MNEVLQTPGAAFDSWSLLDALLEPAGDDSPSFFVNRRVQMFTIANRIGAAFEGHTGKGESGLIGVRAD